MDRPAASPKHVRLVGAIALVWNAFGAFDYLMTETRNEAYMRQFSPEQLADFYGFPAWVVGSPFTLAFSALIVVSGLAFWRYARAMDRRGLLR